MRGALLLLPSLLAALTSGLATLRPQPADPLRDHIRAETQRLQAHFDSVLIELTGRDTGALSPGQRAARRQLLQWLRDYRDAGTFPLNDREGGTPVPFFVDNRGVRCAMAYLIDRSGRRDIVAHVARTRNNAYIADLVDDPALVAWLDSVGLDAREAGRVQPEYAVYEREVAQTGYVLTAFLTSGPALVLAGANLAAPSRGRGWLGTATGLAAVVVGIAGRINVPTFSENGTTYSYAGNPKLGRLSVIAGSIGILAGIRAIRTEGRPVGVAAPPAPSRSLTVQAMRDPGGGTERLGVGLLHRF